MAEKTYLIFGASGGIGSTLAKQLTEKKHKLLLCSRDEEKLKKLSEALDQPYFVCDGTKEEEAKKAVDHALEKFESLDGAVNCIGSFCIKPLSQMSADDFSEVLRINLLSCFNILKAVAPKLHPKNGGALVFASSCAAGVGLVHHEAISSAKAAVEGLVKSAAASLAARHIRVNAVAPGLVDTPLSKPITSNEGALKASLAFHPLGRIGSPEDIASAMAWLLSGESGWITGQTLAVDGGLAGLKVK